MPVMVNFELTFIPGPYAGEVATGTISYEHNSTDLTGAFLSPDDFDLTFSFRGLNLTEANDIQFPLFPTLDFDANGSPSYLDLIFTSGVSDVDLRSLEFDRHFRAN